MNLLDPRFKYIPAVKTNVAETFARFGFRPTTEEERRARQLRHQHESTGFVGRSRDDTTSTHSQAN